MQIELPFDEITSFIERWSLYEFTLFGSVILGENDDFGVLVGLDPQSNLSLFDMGQMYSEIKELFGARVDFTTRWGVDNSRNRVRKNYVAKTSRPLFIRQIENE